MKGDLIIKRINLIRNAYFKVSIKEVEIFKINQNNKRSNK